MPPRSRLVLPLLVLLLGCASDGSTGVGATYDPLAEFPATATWAWNDEANRLPKSDRVDPEVLDERIRRLVGEAFTARGYRPAEGPVNYLLSYDVRLDTWVSGTEARSIGSLSIRMTEAASQRLVWLGFVRAEVDTSVPRAERDARLRAELDRMLAGFPPSQPD